MIICFHICVACNCPSTKTVKSRVRSGATKALVSWEEPEPFCEIVPHASNPQSTSEWLPIGYYKRTYKYTVGSGLPSFDMECHVNIIVTGMKIREGSNFRGGSISLNESSHGSSTAVKQRACLSKHTH